MFLFVFFVTVCHEQLFLRHLTVSEFSSVIELINAVNHLYNLQKKKIKIHILIILRASSVEFRQSRFLNKLLNKLLENNFLNKLKNALLINTWRENP